jgi:hypothetical protein
MTFRSRAAFAALSLAFAVGPAFAATAKTHHHHASHKSMSHSKTNPKATPATPPAATAPAAQAPSAPPSK